MLRNRGRPCIIYKVKGAVIKSFNEFSRCNKRDKKITGALVPVCYINWSYPPVIMNETAEETVLGAEKNYMHISHLFD